MYKINFEIIACVSVVLKKMFCTCLTSYHNDEKLEDKEILQVQSFVRATSYHDDKKLNAKLFRATEKNMKFLKINFLWRQI